MMSLSRVALATLVALILASTPLGRAADAVGLTDDSPLATRPGIPSATLCELGDAGHRRATTMADEFLKEGKLYAAEACYLGALRYKSDFPMALYGLGEVHAKESRDALAREAYQLAIDVWPQYVDARVALGDLHARAGKRKLAEAAYIAAVDASPTDPLAWESLGKHQLSNRKFKQAAITYKRALLAVKDGGMSPGLILGLARAAFGARRYPECVSHAERAASLAPGFGMARHQLGKCKLAMGDVEGAVPALREAARVEPDIPEHHVDLAEALVQYGTPGAAIAALEEGLAALEGDAVVEAALAKTKRAWGVGGDSRDL